MKNKSDKSIKVLAEKIVKLEKEIRLGKNVQENQQEIENIMASLPLESIVLIDDFIFTNKLLTK